MTIYDEIYIERSRQVNVEGFTAKHDDEHIKGELAIAAALYALPDEERSIIVTEVAPHWRKETILHRLWPWDWKWWKLKNRRYDLICSAALIVAEIERLDRIT